MTDSEDLIARLNLYGLAMDTRRWDWFDRIFTPDVDADYGEGSMWQSLSAFREDFASFHALFDATQHMMSNHLVHMNGDHATTMTYGAWRLIRYAAGDPPLWEGSGYYDDQWRRTDAGWRIYKRVCRVIYWTGNPAVQTPVEDMVFKLDLASLYQEAQAGKLHFTPHDDV